MLISRTEQETEIDIPRAADDSGPDDAISAIGFTEADLTTDYEAEFLVLGYGTEVRGDPPTPEREPIVRRHTTEIGQELTA